MAVLRDPADAVGTSARPPPSAGPSSQSTPARQTVTQLAPQHLAHRVARQVVDEDERRRPLVVDQPLGAVGPQPTLVERRVVADDDRDHPLAAAVVGQPEHGRLPHAGAVVDHPLDDLRIDVEAVGDDQVVLAADEGQEPGVVERPRSPVSNQPEANAARVASGLRQYSRNRFGPRSRTDPDLAGRRRGAVVARRRGARSRPAAVRPSPAARGRRAAGW